MPEKGLQPTYKRQRFLLSFIQQLKDGVTSTDLQKLVFLYAMETKSEHYEFIPYKFGPYSFQLADDVEILRKNGFLYPEVSRIRAVGENKNPTRYSIALERGDRLIKRAYREHPYYAINSEIVGRLFDDEERVKFREAKNYYRHTNQTLFTIGYEGKSLEAFVNALIENDIHLLCDVRRNPLSRKFGFSKEKIKHVVEAVGIKYIHIPDLGINSDKRSSLVTVEDYKSLFTDYAETLPSLKSQLEYVYSLLCTNDRIALMCYEKEPEMCHRHVIRDHLSNTYRIRSVDL